MKRLGFGLAATTDHEIVDSLGEVLSRYDDVWANDLQNASGLELLARVAPRAPGVRLGLGVAALDRRPAEALIEEIANRDLDRKRLVLGVGAGFSSTPLQTVSTGVRELSRTAAPSLLCVAAMGPRMCRLAGQIADVVLLNWMTPEHIGWARSLVAEGAQLADRSPERVEIAAYVRVAIGSGALDRLLREAARYEAMGPYRRHFSSMRARWGTPLATPGIAARGYKEARAMLRRYATALDTTVIRPLPAGENASSYAEIAEGLS